MGKLFWFLAVFIIIGAFIIIRNQELDMKDESDRDTFLDKFVDWGLQVGRSAVKTIGFALKQDWLPNLNETNKTANKTEKIVSFTITE